MKKLLSFILIFILISPLLALKDNEVAILEGPDIELVIQRAKRVSISLSDVDKYSPYTIEYWKKVEYFFSQLRRFTGNKYVFIMMYCDNRGKPFGSRDMKIQLKLKNGKTLTSVPFSQSYSDRAFKLLGEMEAKFFINKGFPAIIINDNYIFDHGKKIKAIAFDKGFSWYDVEKVYIKAERSRKSTYTKIAKKGKLK